MLTALEPLIAYIPMDRRQALAAGKELPDRTRGAALFADISGFTPLTETLTRELGRRRGAEELTRQLNAVYTALIDCVHQYGGSVISFSGDAITCWFDRDDGVRATGCALAMQRLMRDFAAVRTPEGNTVSLAIKVALTTGPTRRFAVGDPDIQTMDVLAGATLDQMAAAEKKAGQGEILVAPEGMAQLAGKVEVIEWRVEPETGRRFAVIEGLLVPVTLSAPWPPLPVERLSLHDVQPWLLPPVYQRLQRGQGGFLSELRPAVTLFLRFQGLDYDEDDAAGAKLDAYIRWVQNVLARYEGFLLQITVGDKGSYLYAAYGAPISHGDDASRAIAAALALRQAPADLDFISSTQIGISQGRMRTGAYGSRRRRTYGVLGDAVNISARLMGEANLGQVLVSQQVAEAAGRLYAFRELGAIPLKGRTEPMPVAEVLRQRQPSSQRPSTLFSHPLVGRNSDLAQIKAWARKAAEGQGQVIRLFGPAGVGKSHLAATASEEAAQTGFRLVVGSCESTSQGTPYYAWRQIFRVFFGLEEETAAEEDTDFSTQTAQQISQVSERLIELNPEWALRLPLLGDLLGLPIPDNTVTAAFDPQLRQEALFTLAVDLLTHWAEAAPLFLLVEDAHWIDEASQGLTLALARSIVASPLLLMLVHRPPLQVERPLLPKLSRLSHTHELALEELSPPGMTALVSNRLGGEPTPLTLALIQAQAQGNPYFAEELIDALREAGDLYLNEADQTWRLSSELFHALRQAGCLAKEKGEWVMDANVSLSAADLGIPDSIHGLVLSRLDHLDEDQRLTLKVASVIGRTFGLLLLNHTHPARPPMERIHDQIEAVESRDFVRQEIPAPQWVYLFKHSTTQEVAYETLLFAQRRDLHRAVAEWYENRYGNGRLTQESPLAPHYPLLAYHWRQAEAAEKERAYARLAGEQAAARFANEEAITYFSRALTLTPKENYRQRYELTLARTKVYHLAGMRDEEAGDLIQLQALADALDEESAQAEAALRFADYYEATSDYGSAQMIAQQAVQWAEEAADPEQKVEGLIAWGLALWRRGELKEAQQYLQEALKLSRQHDYPAGEAMSLHHIGTVNYYQGDYEGARTCLSQAMALRQELNDMVGEASSLNNLGSIYFVAGDYAESRKHQRQALDIFRTIGNRSNEAITLNNLAGSYNALGDLETARSYFREALILCRTLGNKQGEALAAKNLGLVLSDLGEFKSARNHCEQALSIDREIGDRVGEGYSLTGYALALEGLGQWSQAEVAYREALTLRRKLEQEATAIDNLAGLARVSLHKNEVKEASAIVAEIQKWIRKNSVHGIEYPLRVYLTCIDVFLAAGQTQKAKTAFTEAEELLREQANRISDVETRQLFLQKPPLHQALRRRATALNSEP